ncbi:MAG: glycosyltransferase family 4 protein [Deltaproteobacteria bacterium]|nr:glycosyltransferase family 4 protein [Deltaproteobacteria bacterium]
MPPSRKKIAYIINVDWYFVLHWLDRARAARDAGYAVHVFADFTDPTHQQTMEDEGFICRRISVDRKSMNPLKDVWSFLQIHAALRSVRPDIVHCITVKPNLYGGLAGRLLGLKTILNVTGLGLAFSGRTFRTFISRQIIKQLYRAAANHPSCKIVFENGDDRAVFTRLGIGFPENYILIPGSGVDVDLFAYTPEMVSEEPVILFAGRLLWDKGLGDVVAAAGLLRKQGQRFRLNVAGIVDSRSQNAIPLAQVRGWHEQGLINWLGERHDMPRVLAEANIVVLPSCYGEGVPRVLIEAAAVGRAIVTTGVSGCRDIVLHEENGLLVEPGKPEQVALALERLLGDPGLRREFGLRGRRLVEEVFDQHRVITQKLALYHSL